MVHLAILHSTRKVIIKAFGSVLDVLHCSFYPTFLHRGMNMMFKSKESACHWIPCTTICRNGMLSINRYQLLNTSLAINMFLSLDICQKACENLLIFWFDSYPYPYEFGANFQYCLINDKF
jgi:hypothetical protein